MTRSTFTLPANRTGLALGGSVLLVATVHLVWPELLSTTEALGVGVGICLGLMCASLGTRGGRGTPVPKARDVVAQDILTLRQAFDVLSRQVQATIETSESAVMAMMERMTRVHRNAVNLRQDITGAVERSRTLSSESLSQAGANSSAISRLAEHQEEFERAQAANRARITEVARQVRGLEPLAELISSIARQTNLLAINASIEAARAGREGAGFKVVATEVRRLSTQTAEAAQQITAGIHAAAESIDTEMRAMQAQQDDGSSLQLGEIAMHVQNLGDTLGEVVPYLASLSETMDTGMAEVNADIMDTLGDMQFQDINRQLLEHIKDAMASLSDHFAQIYGLIDGEAPPPPVLLEELLATWTNNYVMHAQRVAHAEGIAAAPPGPDAAPDAPLFERFDAPMETDPVGSEAEAPHDRRDDATTGTPTGLQIATAHGPRIELF